MELLLTYGADASIANTDGQLILHALAFIRPKEQWTSGLRGHCLRLLIQYRQYGLAKGIPYIDELNAQGVRHSVWRV